MDEKILCMPGILCSADKRFSHCLRIAACFELNPKMLNALMRLGELAKICYLYKRYRSNPY